MTDLVLLGNAIEVSPGVTALFALILLGLITCLALEEKIHAKKSVIAGTFAIICLLLGTVCQILPFQDVIVGSHEPGHADHEGIESGDHAESPVAEETETDAGTERNVESEGTEGDEGLDDGEPDETSSAEAEGESEDEVHLGGHAISMPVYIPAIDWGVIAIILGSSLFVDITSKSGLFTWIGN